MSRFEAEKFCMSLGLNFGLPRTKIIQFLQSTLKGNIFSLNNYHSLLPYEDADSTSPFWEEILTFKNISISQNQTYCSSIALYVQIMQIL